MIASDLIHYPAQPQARLLELRRDLLRMALLARGQLEDAVDALLQRKSDLAEQVIARDHELDASEVEVERLAIDLAGQASMDESEWRFLFSALRIARRIERIGDHAERIAKFALDVSDRAETRFPNYIQPVANLAIGLLVDAIAAFADENLELAADLKNRDRELDAVYATATAKFVSQLSEAADSNLVMDFIFILRSLERIGDLSVNLGDDLCFALTGSSVRIAAE